MASITHYGSSSKKKKLVHAHMHMRKGGPHLLSTPARRLFPVFIQIWPGTRGGMEGTIVNQTA